MRGHYLPLSSWCDQTLGASRRSRLLWPRLSRSGSAQLSGADRRLTEHVKAGECRGIWRASQKVSVGSLE